MDNKPLMADVAVVVPEAVIHEEIGDGAFKVVYRGTVAQREEAIKLVRIPSGTDEERAENTARIMREINILKSSSSELLVKLASILPRPVKISGCDYILYSEELLRGEPLRSRIGKLPLPDIDIVSGLAVALFSAIRSLSKDGYIHRDIKPDNIYCGADPVRSFILLDLGIAFHVGGTALTRQSASVPGTIYYIAPEMFDVGFRKTLDYRSDLYSAGLTIYEYASGINPYRFNEAQYTTMMRIKNTTPKPLHTLRPDLPVEFCATIDQLLKKRPALRPGNLGDLIAKMESFR